SDIALAEHVAKALKELLGINSVPDLLKICRWDRSIPQYQLGHAELQELVSRFESKNAGIFLGGNVIKGISVPDCIKNAYLNTERICSFLNAPLGELNQLSLQKTTIEH
ncbi:MAG: hypothetical protein AAFP70_20245, partial [Calditrichota bacterium]